MPLEGLLWARFLELSFLTGSLILRHSCSFSKSATSDRLRTRTLGASRKGEFILQYVTVFIRDLGGASIHHFRKRCIKNTP